MTIASGPARIAAAIIALVAWFGLAVQFNATFQSASLPETIWILLRFFTIWTNLLVAVVSTGIAFGVPSFAAPRLLGFVTVSIVLVGIVYGLLLRGLLELSGGAKLADTILHKLVPILVPLFWLFFAPKGGLRRNAPLEWLIFPLVYLVYAIARGLAEGHYAYPFMDVGKLGWMQTTINCLAIAIGFLIAGYAFVWIDRRLDRRSG